MEKSLQSICQLLEDEINQLLKDKKDKIDQAIKNHARESRSVGDSIEKILVDGLERRLSVCGFEFFHAENKRGKQSRQVFDLSFARKKDDLERYFCDIKTKKQDEKTYSDGGAFSIGNLLKFYLRRRNGTLLIAEITYQTDKDNLSVRVLPVHCIPITDLRCANLGTGQGRFNRPLTKIGDKEICWTKSIEHFILDFLKKIAEPFYKHVSEKAKERLEAVEEFLRKAGSLRLDNEGSTNRGECKDSPDDDREQFWKDVKQLSSSLYRRKTKKKSQ